MAVGCKQAEQPPKMESNAKVIIFLGPPGSGKGTQAQEISRMEKMPHISTGDLFRENIRAETALGKQAKSFIDKGQLVPNELVFDMLFSRVKQDDCKRGYILDGFPRTKAQAEELMNRLKGVKIIVFNLNVSDEDVINRLSGRLTCKACGRIFHKEFNPPKEENKCDVCGGELYQRPDDTPGVIKERLKVYHDQTQPVEAFFKEKNVLIDIDASKRPAEIKQELQTYLTAK